MNITYIRAPKDVNGAPRRGWLIETPRGFVFLDEGYAGHSALYEWLGEGIPGELLPCLCCEPPRPADDAWVSGSEIFHRYVNEHWQDVTVTTYSAYRKAHS